MEEKKEIKKEIIQEEVKLLTFDPSQMEREIQQLKKKVLQLEEQLEGYKKTSLKFLLQSILLELFGGHYVSEEELENEKRNSK